MSSSYFETAHLGDLLKKVQRHVQYVAFYDSCTSINWIHVVIIFKEIRPKISFRGPRFMLKRHCEVLCGYQMLHKDTIR